MKLQKSLDIRQLFFEQIDYLQCMFYRHINVVSNQANIGIKSSKHIYAFSKERGVKQAKTIFIDFLHHIFQLLHWACISGVTSLIVTS